MHQFPVRRPRFDFTDLPRWWFGDSIFNTHLSNGLHLIFPAGERFFIRSVKYFADQIDDPTLRHRIRAFYGQEAEHQKAHTRAFMAIEAQGLELQSFLTWYQHWAFEVLTPKLSPELRLSTTAAMEHLTAALGEWALLSDDLEPAHPSMQQLLRWHAAEEIEHRSVAFDVLQAVDDRYTTRVLGLGLALSALAIFWSTGVRHLLAQEPKVYKSRIRQERRDLRAARRAEFKHVRARLRAYLHPNFHPDNHPIDDLAAAWISSAGMAA